MAAAASTQIPDGYIQRFTADQVSDMDRRAALLSDDQSGGPTDPWAGVGGRGLTGPNGGDYIPQQNQSGNFKSSLIGDFSPLITLGGAWAGGGGLNNFFSDAGLPGGFGSGALDANSIGTNEIMGGGGTNWNPDISSGMGGTASTLGDGSWNDFNPNRTVPSDAEASDFGSGNTGFGNIAASAFSPPNPFSSFISNAKSMPWNTLSGAMNIGSGIYGMLQRKRMEDLAKAAFSKYQNMGDPYAGVKSLMANPGSVTGQPGYQFGLDQGRQAIQRQGAASGGGGNEAIALARYTPEYAQNFYSNEVARQMNLAGGEANLGTSSAGLALNAQGQSNALASSALGSIGYGATQLGGGSPYDQLIKQMLSRMGGGGGA